MQVLFYMYFWSQKYQKRGGFDSPALLCTVVVSQIKDLDDSMPLNDNGFALDPFRHYFCLNIKLCSIYQIQKLHAVVIHELIVLTPKIIVQQRKLITMIKP